MINTDYRHLSAYLFVLVEKTDWWNRASTWSCNLLTHSSTKYFCTLFGVWRTLCEDLVIFSGCRDWLIEESTLPYYNRDVMGISWPSAGVESWAPFGAAFTILHFVKLWVKRHNIYLTLSYIELGSATNSIFHQY